ncbi:MAG: RT0821/Lpp0805 family surface protein [Rhizobiaceae bacterium]
MPAYFQRMVPVFAALLAISACGAGGGLPKAESDASLVTNAVPAQSLTDSTQTSDANTIRNAISAAVLDQSASRTLAWANRDTGSRGTISEISETESDGQVCRRFETSRESFEGIALYKGNACLGADGQWFMQEFASL